MTTILRQLGIIVGIALALTLFVVATSGPSPANAATSGSAADASAVDDFDAKPVAADHSGDGPTLEVHGYHRSVSWCMLWWWRDPYGCGMWSGHPTTCDWFARLARLCR
jgi:hypothetical protein